MNPGEAHWQAVLLILVVAFLASCSNPVREESKPPAPATAAATIMTPTPSPLASTIESSATPTDPLAGFSFPTEIEPSGRYMFYIHGKIIEDQGIPAISPDYGEYKYVDILNTLQSNGFVVISEQRPKDANSSMYAERVARQVQALLDSKVPPGSITVVGASKGAAITILVSYMLRNSGLNFVLLGSCNPPTIDELKQEGVSLFGNVLAIYDSSDIYAGSCEDFYAFSEGKGLSQHAELVLHVGTGHGILYEPLPEWVLPTVRWANQEW